MKSDLQKSIGKLRGFYKQTPNAPIFQDEFGYYCIDRWKAEGHINSEADLRALSGFDAPAKLGLAGLGWCEAAFYPAFEEKLLEDRGETELVQDFAGRAVLYYKGRRSGFMPTYEAHPVTDMKSWEENAKWRLDPHADGRVADLQSTIQYGLDRLDDGIVISQHVIGGYMYLRSLIGPEELLYKFYDEPELIHACMEAWLALADFISAEHQKHFSPDEVFFAEDICYNHGLLISPDMMRRFLFPYYQQLISNIRRRQKDKAKRLFIQVDTDGNVDSAIDMYQEIGMDYMSPFEVASGSDVVAVRKKYPALLMRGGIDKRILAEGKDAISRELERIMPFMRRHGGYIPTCDHGVPEEVSFENYMHYRKLMLEYGA